MDVLVLGPGGIKGYQELGVLFYLEESKKLESLHTLIGVSVGAIISLLYNVGLSVRDILYLAVESSSFVNMDEMDILYILNNFKKHSGLFSNEKIKNALYTAVINKLGFIPTLVELYEITNKELITVTYDLTTGSVIYMSYKNYPNISCIEAVLLSINIPILFRLLSMDGHVYIDGAFGDPYPVLLKDNGKNRILGVHIESKCDTSDNILMYIHDVVHCLLTNIIKRNIHESSDKCKHIVLRCEIMDTIGINVTMVDKAKMFLYGYSIAKSFNYSY